jgi:hypothetical protein
VAAGIAQQDAVVQPTANHAPIRHEGPIAESVDTRVAGTDVEFTTRVAAEWVAGLERVHVQCDFKDWVYGAADSIAVIISSTGGLG